MGEATQRVLVLSRVPQLLRDFGVDPGPVLAHAGIGEGALDDPAGMIPFAAMGRLLQECAAATGCAHFGLRLGEIGDLTGLGLPGLLSLKADTVGMAIAGFISAQHLNTSGSVSFLSLRDDTATLHYGIYDVGVLATDQIKALTMALSLNVLRNLCGGDWTPTEVHLSFRAPMDIQPYRRHFRAPIRFNSSETALVFPTLWLDRPVPGADPSAFKSLNRAAHQMGPPSPGVQVRRSVAAHLHDEAVSGDTVADELSLHRRTLSRRLRSEGTSFRKILDEVQYTIACQLLRDTDVRGVEIAILLGYNDASGFVRAFRRWSGMTPESWRSAQRRA